jgi:hypothetical protein
MKANENLEEKIALSDAPREAKQHGVDQPPSYRSYYLAVLDGRLPAQRRNGRWEIARRDVLAHAERHGGSVAA